MPVGHAVTASTRGGKPRFSQRSFGHCLSAGLAGGLALFPLSDHRQKFFRGCCLLQFLTEQRFHQQLSQPRQHLDMQVVCTIWSCDQKQQPYRGTIQCLVVDRLPQRYCCQRGHQHRVAFAVGNGHPAANAGRALGFPFQHIFSYSTASRRHPVRSSMPTIAWMAMALSATCIFSATRSGTSRSVICIGRLSPFASNILSWGEPEKPKIQPVFTNTTAILFVFRHTPRQGFPLPICSYTRCTASVQRLRNCLRFCLNKRRLRTRAEPPKKFKLLLISSAGSARSQDRTGGSYAYP